jgi:hypothetical protein
MNEPNTHAMQLVPKTVVIDRAATAAAAAAQACAGGHRVHAPHTVSTEIRQDHGASELRDACSRPLGVAHI